MRIVGRIVLYFLAVLGFLLLVGIALTIGFGMRLAEGPRELPDRIVLQVNLHRGIVERPPTDPLERFGDSGVVLRDLVEALQVAAADPRVHGLVVRLGEGDFGVATAQEIRDAVIAFRGSGKFAIAFAESFGTGTSGTIGYYLASAFDEVWLQPSGDLGLTGIAIEMPFLRETFDKLDIQPRIEQREEYKAAAEIFTRRSFSEPARRSLQGLVDSWLGQIVAGIAETRGFAPDRVRALIDKGPYLAEMAKEAGLVDRLEYWPAVEAAVAKRVGVASDSAPKGKTGFGWVSPATYLAVAGRPHAKGTGVALIYGLGTIIPGRSGDESIFEDGVFSAGRIARIFDAAIADPKIRAILFRVDSPGGSYVASDTVWNQVRRARAAGKPVVVSMGGAAASGGYFVSMAADKVVAEPGTVTGSIGVYGGKMVTADFWKKLGVNWDEIHAGANATMWSFIFDYPPGTQRQVDLMLDAVYADFTAKAAVARDLSPAEIEAAAGGRVWTGADALKLGLVDALGGLATAVDLVKKELGLGPGEDVRLIALPPPRSPLQRIFDLLGGPGGIGAAVAAFAGFDRMLPDDIRRDLTVFLRGARMLGPQGGVLQTPPFRLKR